MAKERGRNGRRYGERPPSARGRRVPFWARMRVNFLTGLVVVAPIGLTLWLTWALITFVDEQIVPWVPDVYNPGAWMGVDIPGFGVVVFAVFTALVGSFTKNLFGRQMIRIGESWLDRLPIVRSIYNGIKQIAETVVSQSSTSFQRACLIEYPRRGIWSIAFVATTTKGEIREKGARSDMMSVFLPTTPNPTSGFLLFVPKEDVVELEMTVEEAAKLVISAGLVTPPMAADRAAIGGHRPPRDGRSRPPRPARPPATTSS